MTKLILENKTRIMLALALVLADRDRELARLLKEAAELTEEAIRAWDGVVEA